MNAAFLSYAHATDARLAPAVQSGLQQFAKPWNRLRAVRVFRDRTGLAANPGLWSAIVAAMEDSAFFILFASPEAAERPWVRREVARWVQMRGTRELLIVLTGGELVWDAAGRDFDWGRTTALPVDELRGAFEEEPQWVDLRWARTAEHLALRNPVFRDAIADMASTIRKVPKDDLIGEDVRQHRMLTLLRRAVIGALSVLIVALLVSVVAAIRERDRANANAERAIGRQLAAQSALLLGSRKTELPRAALLAIEAIRRARNGDSDQVLRDALRILPIRTGELHVAGPVEKAAFSSDGETLLVAASQTAEVWNVATKKRARLALTGNWVDAIAVSADGRSVAVADRSNVVRRFDVHTGQKTGEKKLVGSGKLLAFSPDGRLIASAGDAYAMSVWDPEAGVEKTLQPDPIARAWSPDAIGFSSDGRSVADAIQGNVVIWSTTDWSRHDVEKMPPEISSKAVPFAGRDGVAFGAVADNYGVLLWQQIGTQLQTMVIRTRELDPRVTVWMRAPEKTLVAASGFVWRIPGDFSGVLPVANVAGTVVSFSPDGKFVLAFDEERSASVCAVDGGAELARLVHDAPLRAGAFTADGHVRTVDAAGVVRTWVVPQPTAVSGKPAAVSADGNLLIMEDPNSTLLEATNLRSGNPGSYRRYLAAWSGGAGVRAVRESDSSGKLLVEDLLHGGDARTLGERLDSIIFSPDGERVAGGGSDETIHVIDIASPSKVIHLAGCDVAASLRLHFSPDGRYLTQEGESWLSVWDSRASGPPKWRFERKYGDRVEGTTGGTPWIVVVRDYDTVIARNLISGREHQTKTREHAWAMAVSPTQPLVAIGAGDTVHLWSPETGKDVRAFEHGRVMVAAFSDDGELIATGDAAGVVSVRETASGADIVRIQQDSEIGTLLFSPDARWLVIGVRNKVDSTAQVTHVVPMHAEEIVREVCDRLGRCELSSTDWAQFLPDVPYSPKRP